MDGHSSGRPSVKITVGEKADGSCLVGVTIHDTYVVMRNQYKFFHAPPSLGPIESIVHLAVRYQNNCFQCHNERF